MRKSLILTILLIFSTIFTGCLGKPNSTPLNNTFDATKSLIYDAPLNNGNGNVSITTNQKIKQLIAIPYNTSSYNSSVITQISITDNLGNEVEYEKPLTSSQSTLLAKQSASGHNIITQYQQNLLQNLSSTSSSSRENQTFKLSNLTADPPAPIEKSFYISTNLGMNPEIFKSIKATRVYSSDKCAIYLENGSTDINSFQTTATNLGNYFDSTYEKETNIFGVPNPNFDVDDEKRIYILIAKLSSNNILGYYNPLDESPLVNFNNPEIEKYSNKCEMFYINFNRISNLPIIKNTLNHEFQHLINFSYRHTPTTFSNVWLNEGLSMMAEDLAGDPKLIQPYIDSYLQQTDYFSLTTWDGYDENYGASYLFMRHFTDCYGRDSLKQIITSDKTQNNELLGFGAGNYTFNDLLINWFTAMILKNKYNNKLINDNYYKNINKNYIYTSTLNISNKISFTTNPNNDPKNIRLFNTSGAFIVPQNIIQTNKINLTIRSNSSNIKLRLIAIPAL